MNSEEGEVSMSARSALGLLFGVGVAIVASLGVARAQEAGGVVIGAPPIDVPQTTGGVGAPNATTTIDGHVLPPPPQRFKGQIELNAAQSTPAWPARVVPPKGAPNILLIMTDDVGFSAPSTFGGVIPEAATGFPGYNSFIGRDSATIGRILLENGYRTAWFGKDHNTPTWTASQAGPFDQWPTGMGFEHFYGFVGGDASQWEPNLFRETTAIYPYQEPGQA